MRTSLAFAVCLFLAACGGSSKPEPAPAPEPAEPAMVTPQDCEAAGGTVAWDIGDGSVKCPAGTSETSKVSGGVEPGLCCH